VLHLFGTVRSATAGQMFKEECLSIDGATGVIAHPYINPEQIVSDVARLDLMMTSKLHIGMTALALGIPYICLQQNLKCKAFLHSVNAGNAYWGDLPRWRRMCRAAWTLHSVNRVLRWTERIDLAELQAQKSASRGHLDFLDEVVRLECGEAA
jgi:hypothetical protein